MTLLQAPAKRNHAARHCERKRSNPVLSATKLDCFGGFAASQ
jgi:hypothetical protein